MKKDELFKTIEGMVSQDQVTKDDLLRSYENGLKLKDVGIVIQEFNEYEYARPGKKFAESEPERYLPLNLSQILYYIGGFIVVIGIAVLIWENWDQLNDFTKIFSTFGSAIAAYFVGLIFRQKNLSGVAQAFYLISALVMPVGLFVTFDVMNFDFTLGLNSLISALLFLFYSASYLYFKENLFVALSVIFGSWFFMSFTGYLAEDRYLLSEDKFFQYRFLILGLAYLFLGNYFSKTPEKENLSGLLYSFGSLFFLGSALALGGWSPNQNMFWELVYPGLVFLFLFLSISLRSKSLLVFGTLFLMGYIIKITAEYFTDSLGWPLSLVIVGLCLIAIGYYSFYLNKKYITN